MTEEVESIETVKKQRIFFLLGPPTILLFVGITLTGTVLTDLIVYRTCLVSLNFNATKCLAMRTNAGSPEAVDLEAKIEPYASMIVMTKSLIESLLPAVICLFIGPWSDKGGRRPVLLAAFSGCALTFAILSLMCNWNTSPWYLLLALIPTNIVGGISSLRLAAVCYIFDRTMEGNRTPQLASLEASIWLGNMLGGLAAPIIYANYGYIHIFGTAAACCGMALAFIYFFVPETVENSSKESICGLFKISFLKELVGSALLERKGFHRSIIWLSIFILISITMIFRADVLTVEFLFTRTRLGWDVRNYSNFVVTDSVLRTIGLFGVLLRTRIPGVTDTFLACMGLVSSMGAAITKSLTWQNWHMYLSLCIGMLNQITVPAIDSIISKFVPSEEVGKVFSLVASLEVLGAMAGTPLYTLIYSRYLPPVYPSPVYLVSMSFLLFLVVCVVCIEVLIRKSRELPTYVPTAQEDF